MLDIKFWLLLLKQEAIDTHVQLIQKKRREDENQEVLEYLKKNDNLGEDQIFRLLVGNGTMHIENLSPEEEWDFDAFSQMIVNDALTLSGIRTRILTSTPVVKRPLEDLEEEEHKQGGRVPTDEVDEAAERQVEEPGQPGEAAH
jgi:hypothetical protein